MPGQIGHYSGGEVLWYIEQYGTGVPLLELDKVTFGFDPKNEEGGKGLGVLKNWYVKTVDAPSGTGKINRKMLARADGGQLFMDLLAGAKYVHQEGIATAAVSYTPSLTAALIAILAIRLNTSGVYLKEGIDYTVNYGTGAITFSIALPEPATLFYISSQKRGQQLLINGSFEDPLTNIWTAFATATLARDIGAANVLTGAYALKVTPGAVSDGFQYAISQNLQPGRTYRVRAWLKAAAAETIQGFWFDGTTDQAMAPATMATLTTTYAAYEATFTPTKAVVPNLKFKDSKTGPGAFYVDQIALFDDTASEAASPMNSGLGVPFMWNTIARRLVDSVTVEKLTGCFLDKLDFDGGMKEYSEAISFRFLDWSGE